MLAGLCAALALTGCSTPNDDGAGPTSGGSGSGGAAGHAVPSFGSWPEPSPTRPVVDLALSVPASLDSATGTETVTFVPDRQVCELVFRAWPNRPATSEKGSALTVTRISVAGGPLVVRTAAAGAPEGAPGTLVTAALPACSPAGRAVTAQVAFDVQLGEGTDERIGFSPSARVAWLGSAFPLLAWQNGRGWDRRPAVDVVGDPFVAETFHLRGLEVTAPADLAVAGLGTPGPTRPGGGGTIVHPFSAPAVRDVTVTVGRLELSSADVGGTQVTVALPAARHRADAREWRRQVESSLAGLRSRFGPVPYEHLWVSVLPGVTDGIEYSGAIQIADVVPSRASWLVTHELAHQWFAGLVGNDALRDPWLDEAFATYAQELVEPTSLSTGPKEWLGVDGAVGRSMSEWARRPDASRAYVATVYRGGGRALLEARQADGVPVRFDEAVLAYLQAGAHRIVRPADLAAQLTDLPGATSVLRKAGALP